MKKRKRYLSWSNLFITIGLASISCLTFIEFCIENKEAFMDFGLYMICGGIAIKLVKSW